MFSIAVDGKPVWISLTASAERALAARTMTLIVDMELYFSCLIRKRVLFRDGASTSAAEQLSLHFSPVVARQCRIDGADAAQDLVPLASARRAAFVPAWLRLDFAGGQWRGEFGFAAEEA